MIEKMTKYTFLLLQSEKDEFLDRLQELGVVDISRSSKPVDTESASILEEIETLQARVKQIAKGMDPTLEKMLAEENQLVKYKREIAVWGEYDPDLLRRFNPGFYCVSEKNFDPAWAETYALGEVCRKDGKVWFVIFSNREGFPVKEMEAPKMSLAEIDAEIKKKHTEVDIYKAKLETEKVRIPAIKDEINVLYAKLNRHLASVTGEDSIENAIVIYQGFAPAQENARLKQTFDRMDIFYMDEDAVAEDRPPVKLKNNAFSRQFEVFTKMYGMPVYDEFDPTALLSIFFLLFFAMCMGDAGYGILLIIIGFVLRGKEGSLAKMWSLIVTLGVGTFVVGLVMGTFFGLDLSVQSWVPESLRKLMITGNVELGGGSYARQMILSLGIGVGHICLAMLLKAWWAVRRNGFKNSLGTLGWTLLIVGGIVGLAFGLTGVISEAAMKTALLVIAGVSCLGIFIFNKWGRNPLINIGAGLWDTYNTASGLMGDVLSYIRLYALGLSGSMLGSTFNQIAEMVKGADPTWQWVPFVLILLLGHVLNLAMSCLGAFVHPLRLNFVEFFKNSGYEGRGVEYNPLRK